jgi:hypothetical protein
MKTERVTLLASPDFKAFLGAEARREGVSVGELVRRRCEPRAPEDPRPTEEEMALIALTGELNLAVTKARQALNAGLEEAHEVLAELRAAREGAAASDVAGHVL